MSINIRQKGQTGEREIATMLNDRVQRLRMQFGLTVHPVSDLPFQRNQNQSAVGGDDLTNPFSMAIEVKRQEVLSVNTWWKQCEASAARSGGIPILCYRQNRKPWVFMLQVDIPVAVPKSTRLIYVTKVRASLSQESFIAWFDRYYEMWLEANS